MYINQHEAINLIESDDNLLHFQTSIKIFLIVIKCNVMQIQALSLNDATIVCK